MTARRVINNIQREFFENMGSVAFVFTDFVTGLSSTSDFTLIGAGVGAGKGPLGISTIDHPGIWCLVTGGTAAGRVFILTSTFGVSATMKIGDGGITRVGTWLRTGVLSTALERYTIRTGFSNMALPNTLNEGVTFEYNDAENGGRWQGIAGDAPGVETSLDTGVLVTADTWFKLEFEVNAAGTSVEFFIDDVAVGTVAANIPSGVGFDLFYSTHIMKLIGTTSRSIYLDATYIYQELTR